MPAISDICEYVGKTLILWGTRLFAQDSANPNYKYAWMPPICGKQFGFVICDHVNEVTAVNVGPTMESYKPQNGHFAAPMNESKEDSEFLLDRAMQLREQLEQDGVSLARVPYVNSESQVDEIKMVIKILERKMGPPGGHVIVPKPIGNRN